MPVATLAASVVYIFSVGYVQKANANAASFHEKIYDHERNEKLALQAKVGTLEERIEELQAENVRQAVELEKRKRDQ